jgi:DNA-binding transcriptional LysR family regulator
MELRELRTLVVVARTGSFTSAAAELGYTQSAVSQQVQSLEHEVGQVLLARRPVRPTPAGARLIEHAHRILMRVDVARSELANIGGDELMLRVAAAPLAVPAHLAGALRLIRRSLPSVRISVRSSRAASAVAALAAGEVEVALVDGISAPENPLALAEPGLLASIGLIEENLLVVLPEGHPMASRRWIDLAMLADAPWVAGVEHLVKTAAPPGLGDGDGRSFAVREPADLTLLLTLVAADHGTALVPASVPMLPAGVVTVPLRRPPLVHRTEVLTLRDPPPLAVDLVDQLRGLVRG